MSARQQAGQLRAILTKNFRKSRVKEAMAKTLSDRGQVASGNLVRKILSINESKSFKISYKINKEFDIIYDVSVSYEIDLSGVPYAAAVDTVLGREKTGMNPPIDAISLWIKQKLSNGTWKGSNMYIKRRGNKTYRYPLSKLTYRRSLAYLIARKIGQRGYLQNRSPYLTEGRLRQELAFLDSIREFEQLWENELSLSVENKIGLLF